MAQNCGKKTGVAMGENDNGSFMRSGLNYDKDFNR